MKVWTRRPFLAALLLVAALCSWQFAHMYYLKTERLKRDFSVKIHVKYTPSECTFFKPLQFSVENNSDDYVKGLNIWLVAYAPGRSSDITTGAPSYNFDRIVAPHSLVTECETLKGIPQAYKESELIYDAFQTGLTFYGRDETIPGVTREIH